jgi:hypothetical protein
MLSVFTPFALVEVAVVEVLLAQVAEVVLEATLLVGHLLLILAL